MVADSLKKVNAWCRAHSSDLFVAALIFFVGLSSFGLGRLSIQWTLLPPLVVQQPGGTEETLKNVTDVPIQRDQRVVASKNGSVYHYAWCPGALKIKEENKIWFPTKEDAKKAGLKPAGNCPGL